MEDRIVVAALAVLCLVINGRSVDLNFACAEVALEVRHVVHGVPETEFYK